MSLQYQPFSEPFYPSEGGVVACSNRLELYNKLPDSGERQHESRIWKRRFGPALRTGIPTSASCISPLATEEGKAIIFDGRLPESQGQSLALTVLHVPSSLASGHGMQASVKSPASGGVILKIFRPEISFSSG